MNEEMMKLTIRSYTKAQMTLVCGLILLVSAFLAQWFYSAQTIFEARTVGTVLDIAFVVSGALIMGGVKKIRNLKRMIKES